MKETPMAAEVEVETTEVDQRQRPARPAARREVKARPMTAEEQERLLAEVERLKQRDLEHTGRQARSAQELAELPEPVRQIVELAEQLDFRHLRGCPEPPDRLETYAAVSPDSQGGRRIRVVRCIQCGAHEAFKNPMTEMI